MVPSAAVARDARTWIRNQLLNNIQNDEIFNNDYVRYQDIQQAWSGLGTIQRVFQSPLMPKQVELTTKHLLRFLSILIYIRADDFLDGFPGNCFDQGGGLLYNDSELPFKDNRVPSFGDLALRRAFFNAQYLFTPASLFESSIIQYIDDQRRLPFEVVSEGIFGGAYGKVDKKGISPFYFNTSNENQNHQVKFVACKTFHRSDFSGREAERELNNLQVLKKGSTSHSHIRTHLVILFHRREYQILLPWADHFDLDFFLSEGCLHSGEALYDITLRFPKIKSATVLLRDSCAQMHYISDALKWLHEGFIGKSRRRVHFAHMDLKPNNILIDRYEDSAVGKWILTDFGISTFKEDDEAASADLVSFEHLTFKTTPARRPGAYQPPETEKPGQSSAGRRGDIWAYGCIFAEVLSFALGRGDAVKRFRMSRKQNQNMDDATESHGGPKNDFFYEEYRETVQVNGRLDAKTRQSYRLRSGVDQWLRKLLADYTYPNRAIECCVQTIRDILEVDGSKRIRAERLVRKMEHVAYHVAYARDPNSLLKCPLERSKLQRPLDSPPLDISNSPEPIVMERLPSIELTRPGLDNKAMLFDKVATVAHNSDPDFLEQHPRTTAVPQRRQHGLPPPLPPAGQDLRPHYAHDRRHGLNPSEPSESSYDDQSDRSHRSVSGMSRANLHGATINQDKERDVGSPVEIVIHSLPKSTINSISLCPSGQYIAYLITHPKDAKQTVLLCKLSLRDSSIQVDHTIELPAGSVWKYIVQAGYNFAVWGNKAGGIKHVCIGRAARIRVAWDSTTNQRLASLVTIAISHYGSVALVSTKVICYVNSSDTSSSETIYSTGDQTFTDARFNDDGSVLYVWSFGRPDDRLHIWRVDEATRELIQPTESEGSYASRQQGSSKVEIIPYNSYQGCIIHAAGSNFFPAQIRSTQRGNHERLPKIEKIIANTVAACVFGDHSLIVVEKGYRHTRIREYRIVGGGNHVIEDTPKKPLIEWKFSADKITQVRVVPVPDTDDLMIILCMLENKVISIPIVARGVIRQAQG